MKKIRFFVLLITVLMAMTMLFTSCDETAPSTQDNGTSPSETTQCEHNYTSKVTTEATCTKDGVKTFTCSVCNDSYTEAIAATGKHNYTSKVTTEATCTKDGVKTFTCSVCNDSYTEAIAATGKHNYISKVTTEATCSKDGVKTFTCSMCKDSYTESIAAGHKWTNATCTAPKTCSVCKLTEGDALGHTTDNGTCSRCNTVIFKPLVYSGTGDTAITGINIPAGSFSVTLTHAGKSNFITKFYYGDGQYDYQSLTNEIGKYSGTRALYEHGGKAVTNGMIQVRADGAWTVTINKISSPCTTNIKGNGTTVTGLIPINNARNVITLTHKGSSNFIVKIFKENGGRYDYESLTNEIGNYSGQKIVTLKAGCKYYIEISADGEWTIDFGLGDTLTAYQNIIPGDSDSSSDSNKWSYSEASDLNTYANKATTNAQKAWDYATDAMTASSTYKVLYNQYAVYYAGIAKGYLESMKAIADSNAELTLTNTNGKYSTLQEKIDYAYELCDEIVNLQITSSNYATYEDKILDITQELSLECLGIQKLSVDLIGAFAS